MQANYRQAILSGWPILSVLFLCSLTSLAMALKSWGRLREARALKGRPDGRALVAERLDDVDKSLAILGTIANAAPFIGLLGTVLGIIRAFHSISLNSGGGVGTVAGGISEALVSTAAGLGVAIPASMLYNYFSYHSQKLAKDAHVG